MYSVDRINFTLLTSVITVGKEHAFRAVSLELSQRADVVRLVVISSSAQLLMLCCDKGLSPGPAAVQSTQLSCSDAVLVFSQREEKAAYSWKGIIFWKCCFRALLKVPFLKSFYLIHGEYMLCLYKIHSFPWERERTGFYLTYGVYTIYTCCK